MINEPDKFCAYCGVLLVDKNDMPIINFNQWQKYKAPNSYINVFCCSSCSIKHEDELRKTSFIFTDYYRVDE